MLRHNVENKNNEQDEVELSRRSFFGRLAVGAVLSIAMPGVVQAAKSNAVKAGKNQRLAQTAKSAVRLPKHGALQATKAGVQPAKAVVNGRSAKLAKSVSGKSSTVVASKMQSAKLSKASAMHAHKSAHVTQANLKNTRGNAQHASLHDKRVRDVYSGKHRVIQTPVTANNTHNRSGKSILAEPSHFANRESLIEPVQESIFLTDRSGRFANHRALAFQNPHTGDRLNLTYFEKGRYLSDALDEISFLLRDYRTGDVYPIDPELLDQLHDLKQMLGLNQPFDVVCGYRSPLTNARLHAENHGVANNSFHMHGRAVDIRIERFDIRRIRNAALAMHRGGVGYYPESNFIHLDTGTFRTWSL